MILLEKTFLLASIVCCALVAILQIYGWVFGKERLLNGGRSLAWVFLFLNSLTILVRWYHQGHGPYITLYEVLLSNVWIATSLYLLLSNIWKGLRIVGVFVIPIIFLTIGAAAMAPAEVSMLTPSYRSIWLILHVLFAKLTYGSILLATALSLCVVIKKKLSVECHPSIRRLPESDRADFLSRKLIATSLFFSSLMLGSGAIWANQLWGKYWGWDPVETWALITWVIYGLYLHLRITYKFSDIHAAYYIIGAFIVSVFSFFIMPYVLPTIHNSFMFAR